MTIQAGSHSLSGDEQLGRMFVEGGFLTKEQLQEALGLVGQQGKSLRQVLVEKRWVNAETYATFMSLHVRVPIVDLQEIQIEQGALNLVPEAVARECQALPLSLDGRDSMRVAMEDPLNTTAINRLATVSGKRIKPRIPLRGNIRDLLDWYYPKMHTVLTVRMLMVQKVEQGALEIHLSSPEGNPVVHYQVNQEELDAAVRFARQMRSTLIAEGQNRGIPGAQSLAALVPGTETGYRVMLTLTLAIKANAEMSSPPSLPPL